MRSFYIFTFASRRRSRPESVGAARSLGRSLRVMSFRTHVLDDRRHFERIRTRDRAVELDVRTPARGRCCVQNG